jgi:hypothetical protein
MALNDVVGVGIEASDHRHFHDAIWRGLVPQPLPRGVTVTEQRREGGQAAPCRLVDGRARVRRVNLHHQGVPSNCDRPAVQRPAFSSISRNSSSVISRSS